MPPSSFKRNLGQRPQNYRTPSPPSFASEPISPIHVEKLSTAHQVHRQDGAGLYTGVQMDTYAPQFNPHTDVQKENSSNTMENFASIALATPSSHGQIERPSKRARSEKLRSSEWTRPETNAETRPVTSYDQLSDSRTLEAELLLNFSQEARFSASWKQTRYNYSDRPDERYRTISEQIQSNPMGPSDKAERDADQFTSAPTNIQSSADSEGKNHSYENHPKAPMIFRHVEPTYREDCTDICEGGTEKHTDVVDASECEFGHRVPGLSEPPKLDVVSSSHAECRRPIVASNTNSEEPAPEGILVRSIEEHGTTCQGNDNAEQLRPTGSCEEDSVGLKKLGTTLETFSDTNILAEVEAILPRHQQRTSRGDAKANELETRPAEIPAICSACHFTRNSPNVDADSNSMSWINCDGCKSWFHFACAGFKNEREVRGVDKYRCRTCKPVHGSTTYVRKSSRAHSAIDYAGLNEGVLKTSDERPEHHYIKPIKDGIITFLPDNFARMRPEWVTAEFFEKGNGMKEPLVIPAHLNPQPSTANSGDSVDGQEDPEFREEWLTQGVEYQSVPDHGQDGLDMVMPQNLTVRKVAELYGPEEKVEVIDVKSQNGESKKWNMRRWADYYESSSNKAVRNVISLEVSRSKLGRLIRRPQVVRDLDIQDSVWPHELQAKGEAPRVQLYCLMSVADCFTDFHIDFGGSSVFYHILKGKKTFLFIPPKEKHLKKYEEWCMSPAQNWTFLADQTKECYRVDLVEGDTMLIPAGWIHAVWTPEHSLVIGGNFLTRMHYGMQFRIAQIEKSTGVARKFRYPQFQKLHWYTMLQYLEDDPLPDSVRDSLQEGGVFHRELPAHCAFNEWGENSISGSEDYHARYYSQAELDGLPEFTRYLLRTALIDLGSITEGITVETNNAVKRGIPRGHGEPLDIVKEFALWCAWKRGNEPIPHWAYPHAVPEGGASDSTGKLSAAALKKLNQEAALQAPRRQSARRQSQLLMLAKAPAPDVIPNLHAVIVDTSMELHPSDFATPTVALNTPSKRRFSDMMAQGPFDASPESSKKQKRTSKPGLGTHRKPACESCRKRRRACKHRDLVDDSVDSVLVPGPEVAQIRAVSNGDSWTEASDLVKQTSTNLEEMAQVRQESVEELNDGTLRDHDSKIPTSDSDIGSNQQKLVVASQGALHIFGSSDLKPSDPVFENLKDRVQFRESDMMSENPMHGRGRTKACNDCRKSKRRCIHDELGNEDPVKVRAAAIPRPTATLKRRKPDAESPSTRSAHESDMCPRSESFDPDRQPVGQMASPANSSQVVEKPLEGAPAAQVDILRSTRVKIESLPRPSSRRDPADIEPQMRTDSPDEKPSCLQAGISNIADHDVQGTETEQLIQQGTYNEEYQITTTPDPRPDQRVHHQISHPEDTQIFEQPAASSLVSPPASSHDDLDISPPPSQAELTPSTSSSSRHSSRHSKQVRRYTPESGPARRTSSSSAGMDVTAADAGTSASSTGIGHSTINTITTTTRVQPSSLDVFATSGSESGKIDTGGGSSGSSGGGISATVADEESMKLIKEIQAAEHGLRKRRRS